MSKNLKIKLKLIGNGFFSEEHMEQSMHVGKSRQDFSWQQNLSKSHARKIVVIWNGKLKL